ncbi:hypothetical protein INT45_004705 [Circinella minor]|uniref:RGS domain-containing protein n=1 Tax=Circinella minor TaxID=1195481 RepID=A0A8H7VSZ7_9FUNG|nr:hypothetical protein INT45_004705 [Circinella minor]
MTTTNIPTLESVLDNQTTDYFREFQAFLHQTFCNENLAFWIAIQQYQHEYPEHGDERTCHTIVHTHIRSNSIQEINIPCEMRQDILYQVYENRNYHPEVFTHAMDSVLELMRSNSFIPFLQQKQQQQRNVLQQEEQRKKSTSRLFNTAIINNSSNNILTSSVSCPSIASHHSSSSYSSSTPSVFHRIKRTLLFGNIVVTKRRPSSMPSTPRTSGESSRRSWSPWRKRI